MSKELIEQLAKDSGLEFHEAGWEINLKVDIFLADHKALEAMCKAYAQTQGQSNWQPIETAPKDGSRVVVGHPDHEAITAKWNNNTWEHRAGSYLPHNPTHWQSLPAAPIGNT